MRLAFILILAALAGCATQPISTSEARMVPPSRAYGVVQKKAPNAGMIIIKRDSGLSGAGCNIVVFLDGGKLAELSAGEKVETYIAPGKHMVGARATGLCPKSTPEASFVMTPNATETFRVGFNEASMFIQPSAF